MKGLFIVLEGLDGSGKTTQAIRLYNRLKRRGILTSLFREPGSTVLGEQVRRILKSGNVDHPITELLLFNASRSSLVSQNISPALRNGEWLSVTDSQPLQSHTKGTDQELTFNKLNK